MLEQIQNKLQVKANKTKKKKKKTGEKPNKPTQKLRRKTKQKNPHKNSEITKVCNNCHERTVETQQENKSSIWKMANKVENHLIL